MTTFLRGMTLLIGVASIVESRATFQSGVFLDYSHLAMATGIISLWVFVFLLGRK